jgi:hypothetical protein
MASGVVERGRTAGILFAVGWFLAFFNVAAIVFANYLPFYLESLTQGPFFFVDEMARLSRLLLLISTGVYLVVLLQALFLGKIAHSAMKDDTQKVAAAEGSLKLARIVAAIALVLMFYGWLRTVRTDLSWQEGYRLQEQQRERDWGGGRI